MALFGYNLDEVSDIHRHFVNLGTVKLLNVAENSNIVILDKVDGNTFAPKTTGTTDTVNVQLTGVGQVVVDDKRNLMRKHRSSFIPADGQIINRTCCTSKPRPQTSVAIRTRLLPWRKSFIMDSRSSWGISPCIDETVKLASRIFVVSQTT